MGPDAEGPLSTSLMIYREDADATHTEDTSEAEIQRRTDEWMATAS